MRQIYKQERTTMWRAVASLENSRVVVHQDDAGLWRWRKIGSSGVVVKSSASGFRTRDQATESAYESNPGTPVQVELLNRQPA